MWILRLHISISFLLCLYVIGLWAVFKEAIFKNAERYSGKKNVKSSFSIKAFTWIKIFFLMFCPAVNFVIAAAWTYLAFASKESIEKTKKESKKREEADVE